MELGKLGTVLIVYCENHSATYTLPAFRGNPGYQNTSLRLVVAYSFEASSEPTARGDAISLSKCAACRGRAII